MSRHGSLFRPAAIAANRTETLGRIVLVRPLSLRWLTAAALAGAGAVAALLIWGGYGQHSRLAGQLVPDLGLVQVHSPQPGVITEKRAREGAAVSRGDVLYLVSGERWSSEHGETHASVALQLGLRRESLEHQLAQLRLLQQHDSDALARRRAAVNAELGTLDEILRGQRQRTALADDALARDDRLHAAGYVSAETLGTRREHALEQRTRLQSLSRERLATSRQLTEIDDDAAALPLHYQSQLAELERALAVTVQEQLENEGRRRFAVPAPVAGTLVAVSAEVGQRAEPGTPLLAIVPEGASLQAHLYAPSRVVAFIDTGDEVLLRYQGFPYQKFGHQRGRVATVSRGALPAGVVPVSASAAAQSAAAPTEPVYRVVVELASQTVTAYGRQQPLQAGMALEADVLHEHRRLYQWMLEPLYTLTGRLR